MSQRPPNPLSAALSADDTANLWSDADASAIFRHQLAARVEPELNEWMPPVVRVLRASQNAAPLLALSFADALRHDPPVPELLAAIKDLGKAISQSPSRGVPKDVGKMLYFLAIAASLAGGGASITDLDGDALHRGLDWAIARPWVDEEWRQLLRRAAERSRAPA